MKKVQMEKMGAHIRECIAADTKEEREEIKKVFDDAKTSRDREDIYNAYQTTYFNEMRRVLQDIYDETDEEADRYSNQQVADRYKHLWMQMFNHKKYIFEVA